MPSFNNVTLNENENIVQSSNKVGMIRTRVDPFGGRRNRVIASLITNNATETIEFYKNAFDAKLIYAVKYNNLIPHAEIDIGNTTLMIADEMYGDKMKSARSIGDTPVVFYIYSESVDETINKAVRLGAKIIHPAQNEFYGDRAGTIVDPFGFKWTVATHIKDVSMDEINKGVAGMMKSVNQMGAGDYMYHCKYMKYKAKYLGLNKY